MKAACDLCGRPQSEYSLSELFAEYRAEGVKDVCTDCYGGIRDAVFCYQRQLDKIERKHRRRVVVAFIRSKLGLSPKRGDESQSAMSTSSREE